MRLLLVWRADPVAAYSWMPPPAANDVVVSFDALAAVDLGAVRFDDLLTWEQRSADEIRVSRVMAQIRDDQSLASQGFDGHRLLSFIEQPARGEVAHLLRGLAAAGAAPGAREVVADPALPDAIAVGAHAGLGLDVERCAYVPNARASTPPLVRRVAAGVVMRTFAAAATVPARRMRIAAVLSGKVGPAVAALSHDERRAAGIGAMPFPGMDYGNGARLALKLRIPSIATLDPLIVRRATAPAIGGPDLAGEPPELAAALLRVLRGLAVASWPSFVAAAYAVRRLKAVPDLRALVLPTTAVGAARLLGDWARARGIAVAAVQHGIYGFKEFDGGDGRADVLFAWSPEVVEQARAWPAPGPRIVAVGVPGMKPAPARNRPRRPTRVLVATTGRINESALGTTSFHEQFIAAIAPGVRRLVGGGMSVQLRLHPVEQPDEYRRLLEVAGLTLPFAAAVPFADAAGAADVLVSAPSSVAFEAAALGLPVLMWNGGIPADVRTLHLVPPLSLELVGSFADAAGFAALADGLLADDAPALDVGAALAAQLGSYAMPFEPAAFAQALRELAT